MAAETIPFSMTGRTPGGTTTPATRLVADAIRPWVTDGDDVVTGRFEWEITSGELDDDAEIIVGLTARFQLYNGSQKVGEPVTGGVPSGLDSISFADIVAGTHGLPDPTEIFLRQNDPANRLDYGSGNDGDVWTRQADGTMALETPAAASVANGSITDAKLATDVKVGSLATLLTTVKTSVVAALNELWNKFANYLPLAGGTMTGPLTLSGAPSSGNHAVTKTYADSLVGGSAAPETILTVATGASAGGTSITVAATSPRLRTGCWVFLNRFTTSAMKKKVASVSGTTVTFSGSTPLKYAVSSGTKLYILDEMHLVCPEDYGGLSTSTAGTFDNTVPLQRMFNNAGGHIPDGGEAFYGTTLGCGGYGISGPVYIPTEVTWGGVGVDTALIFALAGFSAPAGLGMINGSRFGVLQQPEGGPTVRWYTYRTFVYGLGRAAIGIRGTLQQPSEMIGHRVQECTDVGVYLDGQQGIIANMEIQFCRNGLDMAAGQFFTYHGLNIECPPELPCDTFIRNLGDRNTIHMLHCEGTPADCAVHVNTQGSQILGFTHGSHDTCVAIQIGNTELASLLVTNFTSTNAPACTFLENLYTGETLAMSTEFSIGHVPFYVVGTSVAGTPWQLGGSAHGSGRKWRIGTTLDNGLGVIEGHNPTGYGLRGVATSGSGTVGEATTGKGLRGKATTGAGAYGEATSAGGRGGHFKAAGANARAAYFEGAIEQKTTVVTADYTVDFADGVILVDAAGAPGATVTVTLPGRTTWSGTVVRVVLLSGTVVLTPAVGNLLNGSPLAVTNTVAFSALEVSSYFDALRCEYIPPGASVLNFPDFAPLMTAQQTLAFSGGSPPYTLTLTPNASVPSHFTDTLNLTTNFKIALGAVTMGMKGVILLKQDGDGEHTVLPKATAGFAHYCLNTGDLSGVNADGNTLPIASAGNKMSVIRWYVGTGVIVWEVVASA